MDVNTMSESTMDWRREALDAQKRTRYAMDRRAAYEEQYRQARDNYLAVVRILARVAPDELKALSLHESTNELDKVQATATYHRERAERAQRERDAALAEVERLRAALVETGRGLCEASRVWIDDGKMFGWAQRLPKHIVVGVEAGLRRANLAIREAFELDALNLVVLDQVERAHALEDHDA